MKKESQTELITQTARQSVLTSEEIRTLATYNSEVARGIVHRTDWMREMAILQSWFDAEQRALLANMETERKGNTL